MDSTSKSIKQRLREYLEAERPQAITEAVWNTMLERLAPVSEGYLRELLRATGLPFDQPYAGVLQHSFEELEETLRAIGTVYVEAVAAGDRVRARYCRRVVIAARDRARHTAQSDRAAPEKRAEKEEMSRWMLVWLENPGIFPVWAEARRRALQTGG